MTLDVHRCRFVDYNPHTVTSMAFSHKSSNSKQFAPAGLRLAVARNNGDIEIWNPLNKFVNEMTIYGSKQRIVEGLVWSCVDGEAPRLFSIGNSTLITEWDLQNGVPLKEYDCNSADIWCISINESQDKLAVGCDDGTVVIIDISGGAGSLEHFNFLQRQDARVLSLAWNKDDSIIGGCADGRIRVWDTTTSFNLLSTMRVDKSKTESTLVWSVIYLPHTNEIVSGDSTGCVKFWDFKHFTLSQTFKVHQADVLTLTSDFNNENVFSAGVDRKIYNFHKLINGGSGKKWTVLSNRLFHSNDIRAITSFESKNLNYLVSGGVEKNIVYCSIKSFLNSEFHKVSFIPQDEHLTFHSEDNLIVMWQDQQVKIWRLNDDKSYELVSKINLNDENNISHAALSPNGELLAVGTTRSVKVFQLTENSENNKLKVHKVKTFSDRNCKKLIFENDQTLILVSPTEVVKLGLEQEEEEEDEEEISLIDTNSTINNAVLSNGSSKLVISRANGSLESYDLKTNESKQLTKLSSFVKILKISPLNKIVVITAENKIFEMDIDSGKLSSWSKANSEMLPNRFLKSRDVPINAFFDNLNPNKLWLYSANYLCYFDLAKDFKKKAGNRKRKFSEVGGEAGAENGEEEEEEEEEEENMFNDEFFITTKYKPILFANIMENNNLVIVERPQTSLDQPPAFKLHKIIV